MCQLELFLLPDVREGGPDRVEGCRLIENRHGGKWCLTSSELLLKGFHFLVFFKFSWTHLLYKKWYFAVNHIRALRSRDYNLDRIPMADVLLLQTKHKASHWNLLSNVDATLEESQIHLLMWENIPVCQTTVVLTTIRSLDSLTVRLIVLVALYGKSLWSSNQCLLL